MIDFIEFSECFVLLWFFLFIWLVWFEREVVGGQPIVM